MLIIPPPKYRPRRREKQTVTTTALVLLAAVYDPTGLTLTLTFDRAVNTSAMIGSAIAVNDPVTHNRQYVATLSSVVVSPAVIQLGLFYVGNPSGSVVSLTAGATNGIVAMSDGGKWAGASFLPLPYP